MTWTYDLATQIGQVRLLIGDTDIVPITDAHFSDEEIQVFLTLEGSVDLAAARALETWATSYTASADSEHIGDYSYSQNVTTKMLDLAARLRTTAATTPAMDWASFNMTDSEEEEDI